QTVSSSNTAVLYVLLLLVFPFFSFHAPPTSEIYTLSLHDALPISGIVELQRRDPEVEQDAGDRSVADLVEKLGEPPVVGVPQDEDRKSTRLNSSHDQISYAVFCLKKKTNQPPNTTRPRTSTTHIPS